MFDLVLRNARIAGRGAATFDIGIAAGKIAEIAEKIVSRGTGRTMPAAGW